MRLQDGGHTSNELIGTPSSSSNAKTQQDEAASGHPPTAQALLRRYEKLLKDDSDSYSDPGSGLEHPKQKESPVKKDKISEEPKESKETTVAAHAMMDRHWDAWDEYDGNDPVHLASSACGFADADNDNYFGFSRNLAGYKSFYNLSYNWLT